MPVDLVVLLLAVLVAVLLPALALALLALRRTGRDADAAAHHALHDPLTGLPNRALFLDRVDRVLRAARREDGRSAVMLVDLDGFKEVNDSLGHAHGDVLLELVGPRLAGALRSSDTIARFGGDEFAVLLPDAPDDAVAHEVAAKLHEVLERPFSVAGSELHVRASIGIACSPDHGDDAQTLLERADVAMYAAKASGAGHALHDGLTGDLRRALRDGDLCLVYQPKVDLVSGEPLGVEALLRWRHPEHGLVPPATTVGRADHAGLGRVLVRHVLSSALAQAAAWRATGLELKVAVNLSVRNVVDHGLPAEVAELLAVHGVPASALELELTEAALVGDPPRAAAVLAALADLGVGLTIDDFGTGHSSLAQLRGLPLGELKIDRSFVAGGDDAVVRSTIDLGRHLGVRVVAEGVEAEDEAHALAALGIEHGQGFLFAHPLEGDDVPGWAAEHAPAAA